MKTYRVAILGCRSRGTAAARAYHAHPRTDVVALCDLVPELRDTLGDELGVTARFGDLDAMITKTEPDIVAILTGTETHYEICMRVLEHGVHIEVEKPLCVDLEQSDQVMTKARDKGVRVAVHHQGRVGASMRALGNAIAEGRIGQLRYVYGHGKFYYGGLGLMNIGTHMINCIIKYTGHCRGVTAVALTNGHPITPQDVVHSPLGMGTIAGEHITATLCFDDSVTATLLQHRFPTVTTPMIEFRGTKGRLVFAPILTKPGTGVLWLSKPHGKPGADDGGQPLDPVYPDHYDLQCSAQPDDYCYVDDYVQSLDKGCDPECSGAEALHVMEIIMGIFESAAYGRTVQLPQADRRHPLLRWRREHGLDDPPPMPRSYEEWLQAEDRRLGRGLGEST